MADAATALAQHDTDWISLGEDAADAAAGILADATAAVRRRVTVDGRLSSDAIEAEQHAAHGLAWLATSVECLRQLAAYGERLEAEGRYGATEETAGRHRPRRDRRADRRRHPDEPERDPAPARARPLRRSRSRRAPAGPSERSP